MGGKQFLYDFCTPKLVLQDLMDSTENFQADLPNLYWSRRALLALGCQKNITWSDMKAQCSSHNFELHPLTLKAKHSAYFILFFSGTKNKYFQQMLLTRVCLPRYASSSLAYEKAALLFKLESH